MLVPSRQDVAALAGQEIEMTEPRFKVVMVLLLVILLLASLVFGLLTYWLGPQILHATSSLSWEMGAVLVG